MAHAKSFTGWRGLLANQDWALAPIFIICACVAWFGNDDPKGKWQYYRSWNVTMPGTGQVLPNPTVIYPHNKDTIPVSLQAWRSAAAGRLALPPPPALTSNHSTGAGKQT